MLLEVTPAPGAWKIVLSPAPDGPPQRVSSPNYQAVPAAIANPVAPQIVVQSAAPAPAPQPPLRAAPAPQAPQRISRRAPRARFPRLDAAVRQQPDRPAPGSCLSAARATCTSLTGSPPMMRLHGEVQRLEEGAAYTEDALRALVMPIVPPRNREEFERRR